MTVSQGRVLLTGASDGLGRALGEVYAADGWEVQPMGRLPCDGSWTCDLADPEAVSRLADDADRMSGFDLCVFAAGTSEVGYLDDLDAAAFRRCLEVNFLAPITLFHALARSPRPCRRFVFVVSGAAELLVPGLSPYALSKRALRDYLAQRELERAWPDCRLLAVWPGPIASRFNDKTRIHGAYRLPLPRDPRRPEDVARLIHAHERAGAEGELTLSSLPKLLGKLQAIAPGLTGRLINLHPALRRR